MYASFNSKHTHRQSPDIANAIANGHTGTVQHCIARNTSMPAAPSSRWLGGLFGTALWNGHRQQLLPPTAPMHAAASAAAQLRGTTSSSFVMVPIMRYRYRHHPCALS